MRIRAKGLKAVSMAPVFDPALLDLEGAIAKNVVLSLQKRISVLVYLALYLTYNNSAQFVVLCGLKKCTHNCNCNCRPLILKVTRTISADFCFYFILFRVQHSCPFNVSRNVHNKY